MMTMNQTLVTLNQCECAIRIEEKTICLLNKYKDVFSWKHKDLKRIPTHLSNCQNLISNQGVRDHTHQT